MSETSGKRYSGVAMLIHWLLFIAVIANWRIAEAGEHAATQEAKSEIMSNHFSIGVIIFGLVLLRLIWRFVSPPPPLADHLANWERVLAKVTHTAFYVLLIVMPLAGWYAMSKYGAPISVFDLFAVPPLPVAADPEGASAIFDQHALAGKVLLALIVIHVLGVLKHTFVDKDGNLYRMLPFGPEPR